MKFELDEQDLKILLEHTTDPERIKKILAMILEVRRLSTVSEKTLVEKK